MNILRWLTRNWAETGDPDDPAMRPIDLALPPDQALSIIETAIQRLPRWRIETVDRAAGQLHATRRTRLWGFVDDIRVRVEATAAGSRVHVRSTSRVGKGDLGQNRRNLRELLGELGTVKNV